MSGSARIRVLLVDDHALLRKGLANLLRAEPDFEVVGEASDGLEAIKQAFGLRPDIILMDLRMPRLDGLEATRRIVGTLPDVKIIMLTVSEDADAVFEAVKRGAQGYLLKTIEPSELLDSLRGLLRGEAALSSHLATKIMAEFARRVQGGPTQADPPLAQLSAREQAVLARVADGKSNKEIATTLAIAESTVKNCVKSILAKLHLKNRVQAAVFALSQDARTAPSGAVPVVDGRPVRHAT
jgi:DNA-binding NarL/FixJ family response regulator